MFLKNKEKSFTILVLFNNKFISTLYINTEHVRLFIRKNHTKHFYEENVNKYPLLYILITLLHQDSLKAKQEVLQSNYQY